MRRDFRENTEDVNMAEQPGLQFMLNEDLSSSMLQ